jgi:3',5'-cyclic AMP phosphodiesterase CpdA
MSQSTVNRREYLALTGAAAAAFLPRGAKADSRASRKRLLRVAHITDIHVLPKWDSDRGFTACLHHIQNQPDPPAMILNTGDCIMDATRAPGVSVEKQWDIWRRVWKSECSLPAAHVLGNHDVWGWDKTKSATSGTEPKWGKGWAMDELGLAKPYHSFDRGGWHFIGLDTVHTLDNAAPDVFTGRLDEEQWAWLQADLAALDPKTPVLVMSHIPIFSMVPVFNQPPDLGPREHMFIDRSDMLTDYHRIKELFKKHPNVKASIAGHIHLVDRVDYLGVTYMCGGAVCGAWWKGSRFNECEPGYSLIDLYDDGTVERQYIEYGWVSTAPQTRPAEIHPDGANSTKPLPAKT